VQNGARQVECTINGIGERAGNCSLEEIVMVLQTRRDRARLQTRHQDDAALPVEPAADEIIGVAVQPEQGDRRAQRRSRTRRHPPGRLPQGADDVRDHRPEDRSACPRAGSFSASTAAGTRSRARCDELGVALDRPQLDELYRQFTALADGKKGILDEEIRALAEGVKNNTARKIA
jgi:2-isopropylmalate synthase